MINAQMQSFELYENQPSKSEFGIKEDNWIKIADINVAVNYIGYNKVNDDIRYKDCKYTGLTSYKDLDISKDYKLVRNNISYLIQEINLIPRYTQLTLEAVI